MSTLQEIIAEIKTIALASGFKFVSEKKVVEDDVSDTLLPSMYINLKNFEYPQFSVDTVEEFYTFGLLMVIEESSDPITALTTIQNTFLSNLTKSTLFKDYLLHQKLKLINTSITNNEKVNAKLGGESCVLSLTISNKLHY